MRLYIPYCTVHYSTFLFTGIIKELKEDPNFKVVLMEACPKIDSEKSETDKTSANHGTPIAISVLTTFVVTAAAVAVLTAVLVLVLRTYLQKQKQKKKEACNDTPCDTEIKASSC